MIRLEDVEVNEDDGRKSRFQVSLRNLLIATPLAAGLIALLIMMLVGPPSNPFDSGQSNYPLVSPFSGIRWDNGAPFVRVVGYEGEWYQLLEFNGIPTDEIESLCKSRKWDVQKRFKDDLVQVVHLMDSDLGKTITLRLINESGDVVTRTNVKMTEDARKQCVHPFNSGAPGYPAWSPFIDAKWVNDDLHVRIPNDPGWYELMSIHGIQLDSILAACEENRWETNRRTTEDLVQVVSLMGHKIDKKTSLKLCSSDGVISELDNVEMSEENLEKLLANQAE